MRELFRRKSISSVLANADVADDISHGSGLKRTLSVRDLTFFGIAAIIGAGSFSSMGSACASGGPGVIILFMLCGVACGFTAMCYAEFASRIPVAGSAYTYAYTSFGEIIAWIIGWALLMEYSIGNIYVAFAWSDYFENLLNLIGVHMPSWTTTNYRAAHAELGDAWTQAPVIGGLHIIFDLPALLINFLITWLVYVGVQESKNVSNLMVMVKLSIIVLVIAVGIFYIDIDNWTPINDLGERSFMPNGFGGVMAGVAAVFFAYIGFDAVSTMAEEAKNPQRDLPRGMIYSLVICTIVYIILSLVLTGMAYYKDLAVGDPLAEVFKMHDVGWMEAIISIAAVAAMTSVILVFQMGQPRIWMSMSRDGLLPKKFEEIHPKYKTPGFSTIVTGLVVGIPILFTDETFVLDFTSIATLFAFVLVCGGILLIPRRPKEKGKFHLPYINARLVFPGILALAIVILSVTPATQQYFPNLFDFSDPALVTAHVTTIIFWLLCVTLAVFAFIKNWSLIPLMGLVTCSYLLTGMTARNWLWFFVWFAIGLVVYFAYGRRHSRLNPQKAA
ncbi:MAG TPA: amino acid permease [Chitinophagales bacterium]|nr:amino acid permease [Chitinophagales bacterium]